MNTSNAPSRVSSGKLEVGIVRDQDDVFAAMAIRAVVFVGELDRRITDEFDGADFNSTLILARVDGEPAGTIRVRWYAGFAKLERVAVLRAYRSLRVFNALARFALDHAAEKGYAKYCGTAIPSTVKLWQRFGAQPMPDVPLATYEIPILDSIVMSGDIQPTCDSELLMRDHEQLRVPEHLWATLKQADAAHVLPMAAE